MKRLANLIGCRILALGWLAALMFGPSVVPLTAWGRDPGPGADEQLVELVLQPARFDLSGDRSRQQLLVTGRYGGGEVRDLTAAAVYGTSDSATVSVRQGVVYPLADGHAQVLVEVGDVQATAEVEVRGMDQPEPVSFHLETLAALSKAGCNMGACHGAPTGKGGFRLSLRGYEPELDSLTLRKEFSGRRINAFDPAESLLLLKPSMRLPHGGGQRLGPGELAYQILHAWIAQGIPLDPPSGPKLERIEVHPGQRVLPAAGASQQLRVEAHLDDGTVRDVTALSVFTSSDESVATVGPDGLVEKQGRGETAVLVRYLDQLDTAAITFLDDIADFAWPDAPEHNFIDAAVFAKLQQLQIEPSPRCSDEEFLRRAYLDTTGRLPRIDETLAFLEDGAADKRQALVERLVETDDFASHWALKWGDLLRATSDRLGDRGVHKFHRWLYASVRRDQPLDQFARQLLTARGSTHENPAANYWRASPDVDDATETTAQLFLGVRIQCAQCHNHPFERWTQDDYYGLGAVFTRVGRKSGSQPGEEIILLASSGEVTQPRTGQTLQPLLLGQGPVEVPEHQDRRQVFAQWLTDPDNPFFSRASANRIWSHLMGRGIVEPVDDFRDSNPPSNERLLDELAEQFAQHGFRRKWLVKTIMNSHVYQLSSRKVPLNADDDRYFSHATLRMLSAEQLLDAVCQVTGVDERFPGMPAGTRAVELPAPPADHYFLKIFGQPQRDMACACERSSQSNLAQALQMLNGPVVHQKLRDDNGRVARLAAKGEPADNDQDTVTELYLAALSRRPSAAELQIAYEHLATVSDRRQALEDLAWSLLNSKEFLFQH